MVPGRDYEGGLMPKKPKVRTPYIWQDMDQAALDAAYDQSVYAPNMRRILDRWATNSEIVRERLGAPQRYAYGPTPVEKLDVYPTGEPGGPIQVFFMEEGGTVAWRRIMLSRPNCSYTPERITWFPTLHKFRTPAAI